MANDQRSRTFQDKLLRHDGGLRTGILITAKNSNIIRRGMLPDEYRIPKMPRQHSRRGNEKVQDLTQRLEEDEAFLQNSCISSIQRRLDSLYSVWFQS